MNLSKKEGEEICGFVHKVLFVEKKSNGKTIIATTYPDEGLFLLDGLGRYVLQKNKRNVCVDDYLGKLKISQFYKLRCSAKLCDSFTVEEDEN